MLKRNCNVTEWGCDGAGYDRGQDKNKKMTDLLHVDQSH